MPQMINTNVASLTAQRSLNVSNAAQTTALQRLSSGLRINSAKDDAAGLAISERMTSQIRGLNQAVRNASDAISMAQTAEGALGSISNNLQRMRELAVQAANGTYGTEDRAALQAESDMLAEEVTRLAGQAEFNGIKLLDGTFDKTFQVGAANDADVDQISVEIGNAADRTAAKIAMDAEGLGIDALDLEASPSTAIGTIDDALATVNTERAALGAVQNRFDSVISSLQSTAESMTASRSRVMDADFASETAALTRAQILQQAGIAILSQANSSPQNVLALLR